MCISCPMQIRNPYSCWIVLGTGSTALAASSTATDTSSKLSISFAPPLKTEKNLGVLEVPMKVCTSLWLCGFCEGNGIIN